MMTRKFHDLTLPLLGFGAMRLPLLADGSGHVDEARTRDMVAYAMQHGLNYFDTAYPYHGGESERIMGRILADYPRESYLLATKFPSHVAAAGRTPASSWLLTPFCTDALRICANCAASYSRTSASMESK